MKAYEEWQKKGIINDIKLHPVMWSILGFIGFIFSCGPNDWYVGILVGLAIALALREYLHRYFLDGE